MIKLKLAQTIALLALVSLSACSSNSGEGNVNAQTVPFETPSAQTHNKLPSTAPQEDVSQVMALSDSRIAFLRIKHHLVECEGYQVSLCFLVQEEGSDQWTYFYDQIEGFDYQWGVDYDILVQIETVETGLADASTVHYTLLEVVSETLPEPGDRFNYTSRNSAERIFETAPNQFSLLGEKKFTCKNDSCTALRSAMVQNQSVMLSFQHNSDPSGPLMLVAVLCGDAEQSFAESCLSVANWPTL